MESASSHAALAWIVMVDVTVEKVPGVQRKKPRPQLGKPDERIQYDGNDAEYLWYGSSPRGKVKGHP